MGEHAGVRAFVNRHRRGRVRVAPVPSGVYMLGALEEGQHGKHILLFAHHSPGQTGVERRAALFGGQQLVEPSHLNSLAMQTHQVNTLPAADPISAPARAASTVTTESRGRTAVLSGRWDRDIAIAPDSRLVRCMSARQASIHASCWW
jgi:hypothetical protein